jgi:hypothetical protein
VRPAVKRFLTPTWIGISILVWAAAVAMVFLGRWQLQVSDDKHFDLQNFGYALQWWAFSAFAILLWLKAIRDVVRGRTSAASTSGELVRRGSGIASNVVYVGPAELSTPGETGQAPVVYRGYLMPQSTTSPARTDGDPVRGAYNDYLWQLALADSAGQSSQSGQSNRSAPGARDKGRDAAEPLDPKAIDAARVEEQAGSTE